MLSNSVERQRKRKERMGKISGGSGKKEKEKKLLFNGKNIQADNLFLFSLQPM